MENLLGSLRPLHLSPGCCWLALGHGESSRARPWGTKVRATVWRPVRGHHPAWPHALTWPLNGFLGWLLTVRWTAAQAKLLSGGGEGSLKWKGEADQTMRHRVACLS